jgi:hypothetical protein
LNDTRQLVFCAVDVNLMDVNLHTKKKNTEALLDAGKGGGLYNSKLRICLCLFNET